MDTDRHHQGNHQRAKLSWTHQCSQHHAGRAALNFFDLDAGVWLESVVVEAALEQSLAETTETLYDYTQESLIKTTGRQMQAQLFH